MVDQPTPNDISEAKPPKRENIFLNIGLNVLIPSLIMSRGKGWLEVIAERVPRINEGLTWLQEEHQIKGAAVVLVIALAFPILYGIYDFVSRRKANFFSILGFVSILISGGIGLMGLDKDWVALKEAAIPFLFAIAVLVSLKTPFPLIRTFIFNPELFDVPKIEAALVEKEKKGPFEALMFRCTMMLAGSFLLSAVLNYVLAKYFIRSESNTDAFNDELGQMTFWSWPVIVVPSMLIMFYILNQLLNGIHDFTGYDVEDVMLIGQPKESKKDEKDTAESEGGGLAETEEPATDVVADATDTASQHQPKGSSPSNDAARPDSEA